jgi:hypothetical protein
MPNFILFYFPFFFKFISKMKEINFKKLGSKIKIEIIFSIFKKLGLLNYKETRFKKKSFHTVQSNRTLLFLRNI